MRPPQRTTHQDATNRTWTSGKWSRRKRCSLAERMRMRMRVYLRQRAATGPPDPRPMRQVRKCFPPKLTADNPCLLAGCRADSIHVSVQENKDLTVVALPPAIYRVVVGSTIGASGRHELRERRPSAPITGDREAYTRRPIGVAICVLVIESIGCIRRAKVDGKKPDKYGWVPGAWLHGRKVDVSWAARVVAFDVQQR